MDKNDLRSQNLELLRSCLKQVQQATKPQLSEYTGLSVVTVNSLLQELLLNEEVLATDTAESSGGRRAQTYSFNARYRLALIVYMHEKAGADKMFISVNDLLGNTVEFLEMKPKAVTFAYFCEVLSPYFKKYSRISVVVVGLPGVEVKDRLAIIDYPELQDTMFSKKLAQKLKCPVFLENDINAAVAGYAHSLEACEQETIVGIYFPQNYPPGAGIFLNGELYKGRDGIAGEIGGRYRPLIKDAAAALADWQYIENAAQAILLFIATWNPHNIVIYNEKIEPVQVSAIKEVCMKQVAKEVTTEKSLGR